MSDYFILKAFYSNNGHFSWIGPGWKNESYSDFAYRFISYEQAKETIGSIIDTYHKRNHSIPVEIKVYRMAGLEVDAVDEDEKRRREKMNYDRIVREQAYLRFLKTLS